jgi:hypothetical protein
MDKERLEPAYSCAKVTQTLNDNGTFTTVLDEIGYARRREIKAFNRKN